MSWKTRRDPVGADNNQQNEGRVQGELCQSKPCSVAVVVPTYNEAVNLPELARRLFALDIPNLELILVDDESPDGTADLAERLARESGWLIKVVRRKGRLGLGTAYREGFRIALQDGAGCIVQMDADLSHSPEYIPALLDKLMEADVVVGSRYISGGGFDSSWPWRRRLLSAMGNLYIRLASGVRVRDATSGFKGFRRKVLESMESHRFMCRGFAFQAEVAYTCEKKGYRVVEHPIIFVERRGGRSKMSGRIILEALWRLLSLRWSG